MKYVHENGKQYYDLDSDRMALDDLRQRKRLKLDTEFQLDQINLNSWVTENPCNWSADAVLDWIYSTASKFDCNCSVLEGENFRGLTGRQLCSLSLIDFVKKEPTCGARLHELLHKLCDRFAENQTLSHWKYSHPREWKNEQVIDWIYYVASVSHINISSMRGESFQDVNGEQICKMDEEDFRKKDPLNGNILYNCLHDLLTTSDFTSPGEFSLMTSSGFVPGLTDYLDDPIDLSTSQNSNCYLSGFSDKFIGAFPRLPDDNLAEIGRRYPPHSVQDPKSPFNSRRSHSNSSSSVVAKRKPGRPRKHPVDSSTCSDKTSALYKGRKPYKENGRLLWKFFLELLADDRYNPDLIRWTCKKEGIFQIVAGRSSDIAKLWGLRKNNPNMNYDKMGRSIRHCQGHGTLSKIPRDTKYPKKLCYKFAASIWQREKENFL